MKTCGSCRHFFPYAVQPLASAVGPDGKTVPLLGMPKVGECRGMPPQIIIINVVQTQQGPQPQFGPSTYPPITDDHATCGFFKEKEIPKPENPFAGVVMDTSKGWLGD